MSGIRNRTHLACWVAVCGALLAGGAWADDRYVSPSGSDAGDGSPGAPWASIAHGVDQMASGTLWLLPGSHTLTGEVVVAKAIVIRSQSGQADDTRVVGGGASRCFHLAGAQSGLRGLTVTNGQAGALAGGGILITGAGASVIDGIVSGCSGKDGGGVYLHASAAAGVVSNCLVRGNRAVSGAGGGVYLAGGVLASSRIEANLACSGGGVRAAGGRVVACVIDGNRTTRGLADAIQVIQVGDRDYAVHQYTRAGEAAFTPVSGVTNVEYLIVAGGGGGGLKSSTAGGGGGAGGMLTGVVAVTPETVYDVRVGHGGTGCVNGVQGFGGDGGPSRFAGIEAIGGGGGQGLADTDGTQGRNGGSGGGGSRFNPGNSYPGGSGIAGQGHSGGAGAGIQSFTPSLRSYAGGGGGGAGGPGDSTTGYPDSPPGHGGLGRYCGITGVNVPYAGGGGGGGTSATRGLGGLGGGGDGAIDTGDAQDGEPGTGGGGGGTRSGGSGSSGSGGSGIVIIRYAWPAGLAEADLIDLQVGSVPGGTGGGVQAGGTLTLRNCLIVGNQDAGRGGGLYVGDATAQSSVVIESCTIADNTAADLGAGLYLEGLGDDEVWNTIIYDNVGDDVQADGSATNRIWYSCLPDDMPDPNCITTAPRFVSADDFRLKLASPCVDAGINRDWMADALDLAGGYRIDRQAGRVDMGCYEYTARSTIILLR